jgi:hypothetical protein
MAGAGQAAADTNDFTLSRFRTCPAGVDPAYCSALGGRDGIQTHGSCKAGSSAEDCAIEQVYGDNELFQKFATEFGMVMSPKFLAPAETLGLAGFDVGLEASFTPIDTSKEYWEKASPVEGQKPDSVLTTMQIHVRKGLPFSFELGGTLTKLMNSDIFALGGELKWAFNEGFYYLPDLAVRLSANRLLGSKDLDMLTGGLDLSISHPFGIGGLLSLTPYAGWNLLFVNASSHVLDATPGTPGLKPEYCDLEGHDARRLGDNGTFPDGTPRPNTSAECEQAASGAATADYRANFVLSRQEWSDMLFHRGFLGLTVKTTVVSLVAEAVLSEYVNTYSVRLGMDF